MPDLDTFDWIVVSSSGGKDSQAMLDVVAKQAEAAGVADRLVVVHADLGRVEWEGTKELAAEQAAHYGSRFEVVSRIGRTAKTDGKTYAQGETFGDLLDYVERRGAWPSNKQRYCTSDFKRGPIRTLYTRLAAEWKAGTRQCYGPDGSPPEKRPCRILECVGFRSQESPARRKKCAEPFALNAGASTKTTREVWTWFPIADWSEEAVWDRIRASGVRHHRAYDMGMPRLSCAFCIFAPRPALVIAGRENPELLADYVGVEERIEHTFRQDVSMRDVADAVNAGEQPQTVSTWGCQ